MADWIHPNRHVRKLLGMGVVTVLMALWGWWLFNWLTPPQDNPFKPLELTTEPGLATGFKLDRLANNPTLCFQLLDEAGVKYTRVDRDGDQPQCGLHNALTLDQSLTPYSATLSMSCRLAASLHVWERHVVIPAAERILGQKVDRIETFGSYSCRRVNSASEGRWSQHATGDAIDISGFRLADGTRVMVKDAFGKDTSQGRFLKEVRDKGCSLFSTTLSPDYNKIHADHLHFDMGLSTICS
jgi:hypothetical protein